MCPTMTSETPAADANPANQPTRPVTGVSTPVHQYAAGGDERALMQALSTLRIEYDNAVRNHTQASAAAHGAAPPPPLPPAVSSPLLLGDENAETPLHHAARANFATAVQALLEIGVPIGARDRRLWTPLHCAAEAGAIEAVHVLLAAGADINARCEDNGTSLFLAAMEGHENVVDLLLKRNPANHLAYGRLSASDIAEEMAHPLLAQKLRTHFYDDEMDAIGNAVGQLAA